MTETAYKDGDCRICGKTIRKGDPIAFAEGTRRDGSTFQAPIHLSCDPKMKAGTSMPAAALPPPASKKPKFVNIGAWVRIEDAPKLLAKIAELSAAEME